jgi:hypothetical protein
MIWPFADKRHVSALLDGRVAIRLQAYYRTAGALLRELSRAVNRGRTVIRAESGLPVGTRLVLALSTGALKRPIEVGGTVTASRPKGALFEIVLRYDFDLERFRPRLAQAMAALRREEPPRRPRLEARVPLSLDVDARGLGRSLAVSVENVSRAGCRLRLSGSRLPRLARGDGLELALGGGGPDRRGPLRLGLEVRWARRSGRSRKELVMGGRFVELGRAARARIAAILDFEDYRPRLRVRRIIKKGGKRGRARR